MMKPSICGAIVLFDRGWNGRKATRAIPTGIKIPQQTLDWLMEFARQTKVPLIYDERLLRDGKIAGVKQRGFGPPAFIEAVKNAIGPSDIIRLDTPKLKPSA